MTDPLLVAGVDGARGGWLVVMAPVDPATGVFAGAPEATLAPSFDAVRGLADDHQAVAVAVDMPMGLAGPDPRVADTEARAILGARRSSLFPTPTAAVLGATSHADAVNRNRAIAGVGISIQTWNLVPRIRELRATVGPDDADRFVECHPETSFTVMAGAALPSKKTPQGRSQRLDLLACELGDVDALVGPIRGAAADDVLDAAAAAWSAGRFATGRARCLGDGSLDADGYPRRIIV